MVDQVAVAYVDLSVGAVEDAVGQLGRVDHGAAVVLVVHGVVKVVHVVPSGVVMVVHASPGGVVMVVQVIPHVHHKAGTGIRQSRGPDRSFMILEKRFLAAD